MWNNGIYQEGANKAGNIYQHGRQHYGTAGNMLMGAGMDFYEADKKRALHHAAHEIRALPQQRLSFTALAGTIVAPWLTFIAVLFARGMWLRYSYPWLSLAVALYFLIFVLVAGVMFVSSIRDSTKGNPRILGLVFLLCAIAWASSWFLGNVFFEKYTAAYYDVQNLNRYPSVDPSTYRGAQLMDAGIIDFTPESKLDLTKSVGFKDGDVYCAAPVVVPGKAMKQYDFWAVGVNCCGSHPLDDWHVSTYKCGEYNIPTVHSGLRLMDDSQRPFFRLAVKEAEATYNIEASQPVFLHWIADPAGEAEAYQEDAFKYFIRSAWSSFIVVMVLVFLASCILHMSFK